MIQTPSTIEGKERKISVSHLLGNRVNNINHLVTIKPDAQIRIVIALMKKYGISQLPVVSDGQQVGSVKEASIIKKLANEEVANYDKVSEIMEPPLPTVDVDEKLSVPLSLLKTGNALLVTRHDKPIDVITAIDIISYLMNGAMA